jgi:hypothetical protein
MNTPLLNDPDIYPTDEVLKSGLGRSFAAYQSYMDAIQSEPYCLDHEWKYYKDGHAWLCKISRKKKTVHWLSIWPGFFKVGYYFTGKSGEGIPELDIDANIKKAFSSNKPIGKLIPVAIDVRFKKQLSDCYTMIKFKTNTK